MCFFSENSECYVLFPHARFSGKGVTFLFPLLSGKMTSESFDYSCSLVVSKRTKKRMDENKGEGIFAVLFMCVCV